MKEKYEELVAKLCQVIEDRLGRSMPFIVSEELYAVNPNYYKRMVINGDHLSEDSSLPLIILLMEKINDANNQKNNIKKPDKDDKRSCKIDKPEKRLSDRPCSKSPMKKKSRWDRTEIYRSNPQSTSSSKSQKKESPKDKRESSFSSRFSP